MISVRKAGERGRTELGWLDSRHSFSFGGYNDPRFLGYGPLRVLNDDRVAAGRGFESHRHREMEILTWVLEGELVHEDSMGNGSTLRPGELQRMTAGTGIVHSERNPSSEQVLRLLQIWIYPGQFELPPGYEQKRFSPEEMKGRLRLVASNEGREGSVVVHQDVDLHIARLDGDQSVHLPLRPTRRIWVQVARGEINVDGVRLSEGDGAAVAGEKQLDLTQPTGCEVLVFDIGMPIE